MENDPRLELARRQGDRAGMWLKIGGVVWVLMSLSWLFTVPTVHVGWLLIPCGAFFLFFGSKSDSIRKEVNDEIDELIRAEQRADNPEVARLREA